MDASCLRFYIHESHKHNKKLAYEWLLEQAAGLGIAGGSVFRAIAGSRQGGDAGEHQDDLMESIMDKTVMVELITEHSQAEAMIELVRQVRLPVFFTRMAVQCGAVAG